mgnify:CR=1 FL=1
MIRRVARLFLNPRHAVFAVSWRVKRLFAPTSVDVDVSAAAPAPPPRPAPAPDVEAMPAVVPLAPAVVETVSPPAAAAGFASTCPTGPARAPAGSTGTASLASAAAAAACFNSLLAKVALANNLRLRSGGQNRQGPFAHHRVEQLPAFIGGKLQQRLIHRDKGNFG